MTCKNCGHTLTGKYCSNCGQKSDIQRISYDYLIKEIPNSIFQLNKGFLFTVKELFLRPGHSIRAFIEGKRKPYYKPIAFLIITTTLYILTTYLTERGTLVQDMLAGFSNYEENENFDLTLINWIAKNQAYFIILILPIFSLASYWAFSKSAYNYFEHLVINFYITGQQMLIYLILGPFFYKDNILSSIPFLIGFIYNLWTYSQLFKDKKVFKNLLLILLAYVIFVVLIYVIGLIVFVIAKGLGS